MFKSLKEVITWSQNSTPQDDWNTWKEWQKNQPPTIYEKSDIFQHFLNHRPSFIIPKDSVVNLQNSKYFIYCFGDFASLIVYPETPSHDYLTLLLDIYDICKGISRRLTGDLPGISILRECVQRRNLNGFRNHNFDQYAYNYAEIHAHTVAQFSLSTLIMRLIGHYLNMLIPECSPIAQFSLSLCQKAYENETFGITTLNNYPQLTSQPIAINKKSSSKEVSSGGSWPRDRQLFCKRCTKCDRLTENVWGRFNVCIDCHQKRICSICGETPKAITDDDLPKCQQHLKNR